MPPSEATKRYPLRAMGADMANAVGVEGAEKEEPTATQAQSVRHDSPARVVWMVPWLGVSLTIDHELPFQSRAKLPGDGPVVAAAEPTALHVVWLKQSTAVRPWFCVVDVSGLVTMAHCEPFQFSIRFCPVAPIVWPTASQKVVPAHETDAR